MAGRKINERQIVFLNLGIILILITFFYTLKMNQKKTIEDNQNKTEMPSEAGNNQTTQFEITEHPMLMTPNKGFPQKNILLGKHNQKEKDSMLVTIDRQFGNKEGMLMHREAYDAFLKMNTAARLDGISFTILSAYRDFNHQKRIWENKWTGRQVLSENKKATDIADVNERALEIMRFSAMPGASRHHWGTDIDINNLNNNYFNSGRGKREYDWLKANAPQFGFCQPYTPRSDRKDKGYEEEKWHWSYLPLAAIYLQTLMDSIDYNDIAGFEGWETAKSNKIIENYIMAIDSACFDHQLPFIRQ
jgi:zinc D-Ala-D-Ala carboxypeptidase